MAERLRYAGFKEEATYLEDPAPAAAFHIDIASATLDPPTDQTMVYGGGRGRSPVTTRPGFYSVGGNVVYAIDIETVGWFLKWALGEYIFTQGPVGPPVGPNTHEIYGGNEVLLPSFVARLGKDVFEHVFRGCNVNNFQLEMEDEFALATMDMVGAKDASDAIKTVAALLLPGGFPLAFHDFTATIAGTDRSADIKSLSLAVNNNQEVEAGRSIGSRYPRRIISGERGTTLSMTLFFENKEELERFWGGLTGPSDVAQTEFALVLSAEAGLAADGVTPLSIEISLPRCVYNQVELQPEGRNELVQSVEVVAFEGTVTLKDATTRETDILVTIVNDKPNMV